jgi:SAM-dependent methyltransferase
MKAEQLLFTLNYFTTSAVHTDQSEHLAYLNHSDTSTNSPALNPSASSSPSKFPEPPVIPYDLRESAVFAKYTADSFVIPQTFPGPRQSELHTPPVSKPKLTLTMTVYNEADRKLIDVLRSHREYIDEAVIIDDGSQDDSGELCREILKGIPLRLIRNETASFSNELELRKQQWRETLASFPEWILNMDADEMFESRFAQGVHSLLAGTKADTICFRLFDMWNSTHYRDDDYWQAHQYYRPFLIRYKEGFSYKWKEQSLHCGRFPENVLDLPSEISNYRIQHWGWCTPAIRMAKFQRYQLLDPSARYGWKEQYESILDPNPRLTLWVDQDNINGEKETTPEYEATHDVNAMDVAEISSVQVMNNSGLQIKSETKNVFYSKCKLCGSSDTGVFHNYERFTLMGCGSCGLVFRNDVDHIQPEDMIAEIYNADWVAMRDSAAASTYGDHALFGLMLLDMFSSGKGKLLEIGSGTGEFIHAALQAGWDAVGIEPSIDSRAYAKHKYDVDLLPGYWNGETEEDTQTDEACDMQELNEAQEIQEVEEDTELPLDHKYEAVACWHVLEHIADPVAFLTDLREQLQPDGTLYITVPNKNSFTNEAYGVYSPLFTEEDHLYHYSEHTLVLLLEKSGLRSVAMFTRQLPSGLDALLQAHPLYGDLAFTEQMGLLAKLQGEKRGHELCCVARVI